MVKSGLESLILKSYVPLQGCCCPVQKKELPRVNEFVCFFAVKSKKTKQIRSFVRFLGESMACQSAYGFIRPLEGDT